MQLRLLMGLTVICLMASMGFASDSALFEFQNKSYTNQDLEAKYQLQIFESDMQSFNFKERVIEDAVLEIYLQEKAKKLRKPLNIIEDEILKIDEPTEKELQDFYEANRRKIPYPFDQIRGELVRFVANQKKEAKRAEVIEMIKKEGQFKLNLEKPKMARVQIATEDFYRRGTNDHKVQVVEFADYQCVHCGEAAKVMEQLFHRHKNKVEFVFIDFPILQGLSRQLAEAAYCAGQQNKYWPYHKMLFEQQKLIKESSIMDFAKKLNLDVKSFEKCLDSEQAESFVDRSQAEGERIGVSGTPSIFVNGRKIVSGYHYESLNQEIESALNGDHS